MEAGSEESGSEDWLFMNGLGGEDCTPGILALCISLEVFQDRFRARTFSSSNLPPGSWISSEKCRL